LTAVLIGAGIHSGFAQQISEQDDLQMRISRARVLAASHNLDAASNELTRIISTASDPSAKDVARIMLMDVYLEQADYTKAMALLEDTYKARSDKDENSTHNFFALAGQTVNGAREHIARYRAFGINVSEPNLPPEAINDLNKLRLLLERIAGQARELGNSTKRSTDSAALLEEVASVRGTLARDSSDRERWQTEFDAARQTLAASETRIPELTSGSAARPAGGGSVGPTPKPTPSPTPAPPTGSSMTSAPKTASDTATSQRAAGSTGPTPTVQPAPQPTSTQPVPGGPAIGSVNLGSITDRATDTVKPVYPEIAKSAHVSGDVVVYIEVDEKGSVTKVVRSEGPRLLQSSAEEAARHWKFKPPRWITQP